MGTQGCVGPLPTDEGDALKSTIANRQSAGAERIEVLRLEPDLLSALPDLLSMFFREPIGGRPESVGKSPAPAPIVNLRLSICDLRAHLPSVGSGR